MAYRAMALALLALLAAPLAHGAGTDPLPSWRDNLHKQRILRFVTDVTSPGAPSYVTPADRVAVFDDDGTLWPERPKAQGVFALQHLRVMAPDHPEWKTRTPYAGALELGTKFFMEAGDDEVMELLATSSAGLTQEEFRQAVRDYFASAVHPHFNVPWSRTVYQPMRELIALLRANGFRCFVVTTGDQAFVRALSDSLYGIPPDDVVGSSVVTTLQEQDGRLVVRRLRTVHALDEGDMKPLSVELQVGRRPILAVGNVRSGGDVSLLRYTQDQPGTADGKPGAGRAYPSLEILVVHDDFEREYAYEEADRASRNAGERRGWEIVSMRWDWLRIFPFEDAPPPAPTPPAAAPTPATPAEPATGPAATGQPAAGQP